MDIRSSLHFMCLKFPHRYIRYFCSANATENEYEKTTFILNPNFLFYLISISFRDKNKNKERIFFLLTDKGKGERGKFSKFLFLFRPQKKVYSGVFDLFEGNRTSEKGDNNKQKTIQ